MPKKSREQIPLPENNLQSVSGQSKDDSARIIGASIIAAAILISGSIFFTADQLKHRLDSFKQGTASTVATAPAVASKPVTITARSDEPELGNKNAKVTMVEFADFQCPYCKQFFQQNFASIKTKYIDTGKVKYVFRHFPLVQIHANAQAAAVAAECANQQGKFWEYHDMLFSNSQSNGTGLAVADLKSYAQKLGLSRNTFNRCLDKAATLPQVTVDLAEGTKAGVSGTPVFYINGAQVKGALPLAVFEQAIEAALK